MVDKLRVMLWAAIITAWSAMVAMAEGDPEAGRNVYVTTCYSCHAMECDRNGPALAGLFGRPAGTSPDFRYTDAMKESGIIWDAASLDAFLADTDAAVPGTRMWGNVSNVADAKDRLDLIAYLMSEDTSLDLC